MLWVSLATVSECACEHNSVRGKGQGGDCSLSMQRRRPYAMDVAESSGSASLQTALATAEVALPWAAQSPTTVRRATTRSSNREA